LTWFLRWLKRIFQAIATSRVFIDYSIVDVAVRHHWRLLQFSAF
jgi:hypothetical protein